MERATYGLIVIGSGPAGEKGAAQAAYFDRKVARVEEAPSYGGAVANTGAPGKAMRETARYLSAAIRSEIRRRKLLAETERYLAQLVAEVGEPTAKELARAEALAGLLRRPLRRKAKRAS